MGYYADITDCDFDIPENDQVLQVLKDLNHKYDSEKRGGAYADGELKQRWFSWMDADYDQRVTSVREVFELLGFDCDYNQDKGMVIIDGYDGKIGQEDLFLAAVAPFVDNGSYMEWRGEDGELWRYEVRDGKLYILGAVITWNNAVPVLTD